MRNKRFKKQATFNRTGRWLLGALFVVVLHGFGFPRVSPLSVFALPDEPASHAAPDDTTSRFKIKKTVPTNEDDVKPRTADLKTPENLKEGVDYDEKSGIYYMGTRLGDSYLNTPILMSEKEYRNWSLQKSMQAYYRNKNDEEFRNRGRDQFDFTNMQFDLGAASKIFGPGGVQIKTQGSAELKIGANTRNIDNPSLPERNRKTFGFDFQEKINVNVNGKVGDKVDMNINYNSEATFDFDTKNIKLKYEGKEDEIIKLIEAGDVSMPTNSSLIKGSSSLFGIRTDLQFGKLKLQTIVSQKKSTSKSVSSQGGIQITPYELNVTDYEENRHFFLAHFFRDNYDRFMAQLPNITSGITINRIEVWITNKTGTTSNTRNIVAFTDLAEYEKTANPTWVSSGEVQPANTSNNLYQTVTTTYSAARDISQTTSVLDGANGMGGGVDYEKLESARLLSSSDYTLNASLGYISLKTTLQPDQVLAVAYEYTYRGQSFQVGEFSTDIKDNSSALFVKALKNTSNVPSMGNWPLMMKNVYALGATSIQKQKFRLDIKYLSDTTGVYLSYLPEEQLKDTTLLRLMNLDRLDNNNRSNPNGYFDYVEGYTVVSQTGRVYFPVVEPFGSHLEKVINNPAIASKYTFKELYDSTKTTAKQIAEKDKFLITGEFQGSTGGREIQLDAMNVPQGSVIVTAGGTQLVENVDYVVNYSMGTVEIINQSILDAGTPINVSLESNTNFGMERKTMLGLNWQYDFTKSFQLGGTIMHLSEQALTNKVRMGEEPLNNTLWGLNLSWKQKSQWLTNMLDKLPFLNCTAPSSINLSAEFAQLIAGSNSDSQGDASYLDDFENTKAGISISSPLEWNLSSCPSNFSESKLSNDVRYGYNRALISWYHIDPLFTRRSSSLTPSHIKSDLQQLSNHYVREVYRRELFPNRRQAYGESSTLPIFNIAYYPSQRGPYNLDPDVNEKGELLDPKKRWGGMMRRIETSDFETANIEYIEFWMMDPFIYTRGENGNYGGDLYIDLGEISEDILKDGKKYYESGMPTDGDPNKYTETAWGRVPTQNSVTYAFNTSSGSRDKQDVGLNGLNSTEEATFGAYQEYLKQIQGKVSPEVFDSIAKDPAGDDFHYFRGTDFDRAQTPILDRYKRIVNPEGNSVDSEHSPESYNTTYKMTPDVEDINQDYTLNEYEKYYQYRVPLNPDSMQVGYSFITDKRTSNVSLRNGNTATVDWYLFRIPLKQYESKNGTISDFNSIRFMRMFLTNFEKPIVLRFATLELVRGEWRNYEQSLYTGTAPSTSGSVSVSAVNLEENGDKVPVNYVLPPGIKREIYAGGATQTEENEQSLSFVVNDLISGDARAVYKNTNMDLRRYKHLQMFVHANALIGDNSLENGQVSLFVRIGSDYKNNFYEYEIPLTLTPEGKYPDNESGRKSVWPIENMLDIDLDMFTDLKRERNKKKAFGMASYAALYSEYDEAKPNNKISIMGNPSLGEIRTIMIGVRNNSRATKSIEVWANELRLQQYSNKGGWAAQGKLNLQLSDVASVNLTGHVETDGFGGLEEGVTERRNDNLYQYSVTTNVDLGRFLPEKAKVQAPVYYSYSREKTVPKYNPLDTDLDLQDVLDASTTKRERDSLENICTSTVTNSNFSLSNAKINIASRNPMPYDPANFSFGYSHSHKRTTGETTAWETDDTWKWLFNYNYSPSYKGWQPFKNIISKKSKWGKMLYEEQINYLPQNVTFNSDITRSYYELQERDMENLNNKSLPLTWASDFLWNRQLAVRWDLTKTLNATYTSATNAEIVQPYCPVNENLYPDRYTAWKDSVWHSIKNLGTPLSYQQTFKASWKAPINKLPCFSWITTDVSYSSNYSWDRGADPNEGTFLGNTIANARTVNANANFKLETLYNFIPFLKQTNNRFSNATKKKEVKPKPYEKEIQLRKDTTLTVNHNLKNKKVRVTAIREDGTHYAIRYKVKDQNQITILNHDSIKVKLKVVPGKKTEDMPWYRTMQYVARAAMMVRSINVSYTNSYNMSLPGFLPQIGDMFGQRSEGGLQPGLDFAFGFTDDSYIRKAFNKGWLLANDSIATPATTNANEDFQVKVVVEPFKDFKIDLNASRRMNKARSIQYMYDGMPTTQTGSFTMTTISISSAFEGIGSADNNYSSKSFKRFVNYLDAFRDRVEARYTGTVYPAGTALAGKPFDPANGTISKYSSDVMIPAFLAAYCGGSTSSSLDIFPSLLHMLPNWKITYGGLVKLPWVKDHFKSINLNHSYQSIYQVGAYNTYNSYMGTIGGMGFINDITTGQPTPSSMYDISSVSINETFSPLIGVDMTFNNNLTAKVEYKKTRVLNLSMTSQQINETSSNDFVIGLGYKINDFKIFKKSKNKRTRRTAADRNKTNQTTTTATSTGMNNDLNIRVDFSLRDQSALCRDILTQNSQATSGNKALKISFSADYTLSKLMTLSAYYDRQTNTPLLSSSSYPTTTQDFGVSMRISLTR